jgi:hypothetical protein
MAVFGGLKGMVVVTAGIEGVVVMVGGIITILKKKEND